MRRKTIRTVTEVSFDADKMKKLALEDRQEGKSDVTSSRVHGYIRDTIRDDPDFRREIRKIYEETCEEMPAIRGAMDIHEFATYYAEITRLINVVAGSDPLFSQENVVSLKRCMLFFELLLDRVFRDSPDRDRKEPERLAVKYLILRGVLGGFIADKPPMLMLEIMHDDHDLEQHRKECQG